MSIKSEIETLARHYEILETLYPDQTHNYPQLADKTGLTTTTISSYTIELEKHGLVKTGTNPTGPGRPTKHVTLTPRARKLLTSLKQPTPSMDTIDPPLLDTILEMLGKDESLKRMGATELEIATASKRPETPEPLIEKLVQIYQKTSDTAIRFSLMKAIKNIATDTTLQKKTQNTIRTILDQKETDQRILRDTIELLLMITNNPNEILELYINAILNESKLVHVYREKAVETHGYDRTRNYLLQVYITSDQAKREKITSELDQLRTHT